MKRKFILLIFILDLLLVLAKTVFNIDHKFMFVNLLIIIVMPILSILIACLYCKKNFFSVFFMTIVIVISNFLALRAGTIYSLYYVDETIYIDEYNFPNSKDRLILLTYDSGGYSGPTEVIYEDYYILGFKQNKVLRYSKNYYEKFDLEEIYNEINR